MSYEQLPGWIPSWFPPTQCPTVGKAVFLNTNLILLLFALIRNSVHSGLKGLPMPGAGTASLPSASGHLPVSSLPPFSPVPPLQRGLALGCRDTALCALGHLVPLLTCLVVRRPEQGGHFVYNHIWIFRITIGVSNCCYPSFTNK